MREKASANQSDAPAGPIVHEFLYGAGKGIQIEIAGIAGRQWRGHCLPALCPASGGLSAPQKETIWAADAVSRCIFFHGLV